MVQGINLKNYSVEQLKELKQAGVEGISDNDIKVAEQKEAEEAKASDEAQISYQITEDASEVNEAEQEVDSAKENGVKLKGILETLMEKCSTKNNEMSQLQEEMNAFMEKSETAGNQLGAIATLIDQAVNSANQKVEQKQAEVEDKQAEIENKQKEAEEIVNKTNTEGVTEDEQAKVETLNSEIESEGINVSSLLGQMQSIQNDTKSLTVSNETKAKFLGSTLEDIKNSMTEYSNKAINTREYADVAIEQGTEAVNINDKKTAKKAGFIKGGSSTSTVVGATTGLLAGGLVGGIIGAGIGSIFGRKKGDVKMAHNMGNATIDVGKQLQNTSQKINNMVNQIGAQYDLGFANTESIENAVDKATEDVTNTSKMIDAQDIKEGVNTNDVSENTLDSEKEDDKKKDKKEQA